MRGICTPEIQRWKRLGILQHGDQSIGGLCIMAGRKGLGAVLIMLVPLRFFLRRQKQGRKENYKSTPPAVTPDVSHMLPPKTVEEYGAVLAIVQTKKWGIG